MHLHWTSTKYLTLLISLMVTAAARADSPWLYGIHWWGYTQGQNIDTTPAGLLDCPAYGGWDLETVLTHNGYTWGPWYILPLYLHLTMQQNMTMITRIDYRWDETVPAPANPDHAGWPADVVNLVDTLADGCHLWVIGNEPNHVGIWANWLDGTISPEAYADIYTSVRHAVHDTARSSRLGPHRVLFTAVAPNATSNEWLAQAIDHVPAGLIDGFTIHAYGRMDPSFHDIYTSILAVIDQKGYADRPVYMTEMGYYATPGQLQEEADAARFSRDAFADVHAWNQVPGHHNIVSMMWFVYDADQQGMGVWDGFSIEYYRDHGVPLGDPDNLFTAFEQTVDHRYPAGAVGTTPPVPGDFDGDGDVDSADFNTFQGCVSGPAVPPDGSQTCQQADLDNDHDVDQSDFGIFQRCLSGENNLASPGCAGEVERGQE